MDHALQAANIPPPLLRDPNLDYLVTSQAWADEVRLGVVETYRTASRHVTLFNEAARSGDPAAVAMHWGVIVGLAGNAPMVLEQLYFGVCE